MIDRTALFAHIRIGVLLLGAILLGACSEDTGAVQTQMPVEATDAPTIEAPAPTGADEGSTGPAPLTAATPAVIIEPSEPAATPTLGPPSFGVPLEELVIFSPGPGSFASQAVRVNGYGGPSLNNRVRLLLFGEDGRKLSEGYAWLYSYPGTPGIFYTTMPYQIPFVAEMGWLQVRSYGDRYGNLKHVNTIGVTLLSEGSEKIYPALHGPEQLSIFSPREEAIVEGGTAHVEGAGWVDHDGPLIVQVLDRAGTVLGSAEVEIDAPMPGHVVPFSIDVPYQVPYPQWARIGVAESHPLIDGPAHYASVEVWLRP